MEVRRSIEVYCPSGKSDIVFSVPHDGYRDTAGLSPRTSGTTRHDVQVSDIVRDMVELLPAVMVRELLSRTVLDCNRAEEKAFEDVRAKVYYDHYHATLENLLKKGKLLVDVHGFSSALHPEGYDLVLSSADPTIATALHLPEYTVATNAIFPAGHTTTHYSLKGIPSLQIEISDTFRKTETRELGKRLSRDLAEALTKLLFESTQGLENFKRNRENYRVGLV